MNDIDRIEAEAIAAEIQRRPAFHLACAWLERMRQVYGDEAIGLADEFSTGWVDVDRVLTTMQAHTGARVNEETALVALEHCGFKVRNTKRGMQTNLAEKVLLDAWQSTHWGKQPARALPDLSDPTPQMMGMN